ncbi:disease resistance protein RUN1-like [Eucalyptus grandis]|uniref:disease resistance protein RUN1-like n=1 Tax=Eucalyptus grandis TaxID=71139 RepID=UPI00192E9D52|nr:disease resistance protein RUN1-like [Eucalyptus grandis]
MGTSTSNTLGSEYQVFLNFRGVNTRRGFTSSLYHALVDAEIRVFIDDKELRAGETISGNLLQAIDDSKLYIPIFSKNYASSHWCLRELAKIVENTSNSKEDGKKKVILPIFYDVEPDDVKLKTALYSKAISNLEQKMEDQKKFSSEDIKTWQSALKEVDAIKGWELKKIAGHGDLIKSVVDEVVIYLKTRQRQVTGDLVGTDNQIAAINYLLDTNFGGVRFLDDVRERAQAEGLHKLQAKLLSNISRSMGDHVVDNIDNGINMITEIICNKKVLIVLDDVAEADQIQKLIGRESLYPGTRIIITTRDKSVLNNRRSKYKFKEYEMVRLSEEDALKLFSRHAFNEDSPPNDYYTLSRRIVSTADGLPLALQAIGSSLFQKKRKTWEEWLRKLKKTLHNDVSAKLKISYESLETNEKEIFLDIACFLVGENKSNPMYMWKDYQGKRTSTPFEIEGYVGHFGAN